MCVAVMAGWVGGGASPSLDFFHCVSRPQHNNVYVLALTRRNSNVTAVFVFLEKLVEVMREYFGQLEEVRAVGGTTRPRNKTLGCVALSTGIYPG